MNRRRLPAQLLIIAALSFALPACGAGKAARELGQLFDKYGCMAKELKGEPPCPAPAS